MASDETRQAEVASPSSLVEDYSYPGADQIEAATGVRLIEGDGNIIKVSCETTTPVIRVESTDSTVETSCYEVLGSHGWLKMKIPDVYVIKGDDHNVNARLTVGGQTQVINVDPGEYKPVGVGRGSDHDPATLVELRVS